MKTIIYIYNVIMCAATTRHTSHTNTCCGHCAVQKLPYQSMNLSFNFVREAGGGAKLYRCGL